MSVKRTWEDVRNRIIDLGFEKQNVYTKQKDAFIRAANTWQNYISEQACPISDYVTIEVTSDNEDYDYQRFDMKTIVEEMEDEEGNLLDYQFLSITDEPIYTEDGYSYIDVGSYRKEGDRYLLIPTEYVGTWRVKFNRYPKQIDSTWDTDELEIDGRAADIVPYFVAHDMWADDDLAKATVWYNIGVQLLADLKESNQKGKGYRIFENTTGWWS